jgi:glycosyltransferase involved in cell wall biosynthesis
VTERERTETDYSELITAAEEKLRQGQLESALDYTRVACWSAWKNPVLWDSSAADAVVSSVGKRLARPEEIRRGDRRNEEGIKTAFVASSLADHGGHSESMRLVIEYLVKNTPITVSSVILTNTRQRSEFPVLREKLNEFDIDILEFDFDKTYVDRVTSIRRWVTKQAIDKAVMFIDPDDVVAVSAFAQSPLPETILYNHADHVFWLGGNIVDKVIDARTEGLLITEKYRQIESEGVISLMTGIEKSDSLPSDIDLQPEASFSISVGSEYKFRLDGGEKYLRTVEKILRECPDHQHILITALGDAFPVESVASDVRSRFILAGPYPDLSSFYTHADFLLDSIPFGGSMVRLEAIACGTPVLAFVNPDFPFVGNNDLLPWDHELIASDVEGVAELALRLSHNNALREKTIHRQNTYYESIFPESKVGARWQQILTDGLSTRLPEGLKLDRPEKREVKGVFDLRNLSFSKYRKCVAEFCHTEVSTIPEYKMADYSSFLDLRSGVQKQLLRQVVSKTNSVDLTDRIGILQRAIKRGELDSPSRLLAYGLLAVSGTAGYPVFSLAEDHSEGVHVGSRRTANTRS